MYRVKFIVAMGIFLALSVLAVSGMIASTKNRRHGRMRWNDNDDRR